ncbi:MAG TPA: hypothetical protein VF669_07070 [Tepidisphaeraceae bacterium]|jgi:hypothetical protein
MKSAIASIADDLLSRNNGLLPLAPTFVHRFYPDLNRLNQNRLKRSPRQFIPERWIGSSVEAVNPAPLPSGGLSMLAAIKAPVALRDVLRENAIDLLGPTLTKKHGREFRCLVKILDPGEPIVFHLHANDAQVKKSPATFPGQQFGKDEAYYFLESPKGPQPYTHAGLYEGVSRRELVAAVKRGPQHALELSPVIYQNYEEGFFVPAATPHRPGTALTLEIQQPSDVYTLLETHAAGKPMPPEQIHPGFESLEDAFRLIDFTLAYQVGQLEGNRLVPSSASKARGGAIDWIFPTSICKKFGGKRIRVASSLTYSEETPFVLWGWKGRGAINGRALAPGGEFFVPYASARSGIELRSTGDEHLEVFSFFPGT